MSAIERALLALAEVGAERTNAHHINGLLGSTNVGYKVVKALAAVGVLRPAGRDMKGRVREYVIVWDRVKQVYPYLWPQIEAVLRRARE